MNIKIKRFDANFPLPAPTDKAACFDFICRETVTIQPHQIRAVAQNVAIEVPDGHALLIFSRSSTAHKRGVMLANGVGVVDPFYCGDDDENLALLINVTDKPVTVSAGDKIVQGMIMKTEAVVWNEVKSMKSKGHGGYHHIDGLK